MEQLVRKEAMCHNPDDKLYRKQNCEDVVANIKFFMQRAFWIKKRVAESKEHTVCYDQKEGEIFKVLVIVETFV